MSWLKKKRGRTRRVDEEFYQTLIATRANDDEIAIAPFAEAPFSLAALWPDE